MKTSFNTFAIRFLLPTLFLCAASFLSGCGKLWSTVSLAQNNVQACATPGWNSNDDFVYAPGQTSGASFSFLDSIGNIYVGGAGTDAGGVSHWIIRKSSDHGRSWAVSDDFNYAPLFNGPAAGFADSSGALIVAG